MAEWRSTSTVAKIGLEPSFFAMVRLAPTILSFHRRIGPWSRLGWDPPDAESGRICGTYLVVTLAVSLPSHPSNFLALFDPRLPLATSEISRGISCVKSPKQGFLSRSPGRLPHRNSLELPWIASSNSQDAFHLASLPSYPILHKPCSHSHSSTPSPQHGQSPFYRQSVILALDIVYLFFIYTVMSHHFIK